jgi:GntR family transcriptional regulator
VEALGPAAEETRRVILDDIRNGRLRPGQKLQPERDLASHLGVSRSTLRAALTALEHEGAVKRLPGRGGGTFVSAGKVERDLSRIVGVPSLLRDQGFTAGTQLLSAALVAADTETATALDLAPGEFVFDIVRIRLADSQPISLEHARLPAQMFPGLLGRALSGSLYELLQKHYDTHPDQGQEQVEVVSAGPDEARILGIDIGAPLLSVVRTTLDTRGRKIEYSHDLFRGDRTRITVRTVRR